MSYPDQSTDGRARIHAPAAVGLAATLLAVMAGAGLASVIAVLVSLNGVVGRFREAAAGTGATPEEITSTAGLIRAFAVVATVLAIMVAVLLIVLALGLLSGGNGVRIAAWMVCGAGLLCGCAGLGALAIQRLVPLRLGADEQVTAELLTALTNAYPSWWVPLNAVLSVGQVLGYLVVAMLLALPAARNHYRRQRLVQPPAPATTQPATPGSAPPSPVPPDPTPPR